MLEVPPAPTVAGTVIDPDGKPVAGADVWLSQYGNMFEGAVVTKADAKGEFVLRGVSPIRWVAARAPGHAPSPAYAILDGKPADTIRLQMVLGGPAGAVSGNVTRRGWFASGRRDHPRGSSRERRKAQGWEATPLRPSSPRRTGRVRS